MATHILTHIRNESSVLRQRNVQLGVKISEEYISDIRGVKKHWQKSQVDFQSQTIMRKKSIDNGGIKNEKISKRQENSYKTVKEEERAAGGGKKNPWN